ncbi:MAG: C69 family dipeptidase [Bacteroidales bacterium]|nr:C69 family dipeptidase [Bacteroidales bacterium]
MKRYLLLLAALVGITASACTNLLVGKKASKTGATYISYSADSYGMYGRLLHFPAGKHAPGTMRKIVDGDTHQPLGEIPEAPETYNVMGNINEYQLAITETTFSGREELAPKRLEGGIDYVSLMQLGLQRAKNAREAIKVMTDLVARHGYSSTGESFSIADPNEVWVLEMIGKGDEAKGAVWVAVRIPDDCIAAHANQSRIHQFDMKDKKNVMYSKDVIKFARSKGYFKGKDADFSFSAAYSPADFGSQRWCDARAWSFFNKHVEGMERYLPFVTGKNIGKSEVMPLYFKPTAPLSLSDVMEGMRDHYEGTALDFSCNAASGVYCAPYQPSPLKWKHDGKEYFNERPISTQQASYVVVAELRSWLPREVGGILWYGNDDPNMVPFTPIYCSATTVPECYADATANDHTFSWKSAFWLQNWVSNMVYPRYQQLFPELKAKRDQLEKMYATLQPALEALVVEKIKAGDTASAIQELDTYTTQAAERMMLDWKALGERLIMKFNDQVVKKEKNGQWELTPHGICVPPERPGYPEQYRKELIKATDDRFLMPQAQ